MSLLLPFSNHRFHVSNNSKPMAISSITSPPTSIASSTTEEDISPSNHGTATNNYYSSQDLSASLTLQERRLRNKTASAKYRAKKNQQHCEMRAMISTLTKENELLIRQLEHMKHENNHLKATCDKLRGKMIAQKMLKQYLVENEQRLMLTTREEDY